MRKSLTLLMALLCVSVITLDFANRPQKESGRLLADWISVHLKLVKTTKGVPHVAYSRHFAYTAIAFYEAMLPGNKKYKSMAGQLQELKNLPSYTPQADFVATASASAAYADMLRYFYGKNPNASLIDSMETASRSVWLRSGGAKGSIENSVTFGRSISKTIQQWSETDHANNANDPYVAPSGEGLWVSTPPTFSKAAVPYWKNNRTFINVRANELYTVTPPQYSTLPDSKYLLMSKEVFDVSQRLTEEQKEIAWHWDDSPGKFLTVPGHWSSILAQVIKKYNTDLATSAEAYLKMHLALHDASVVAWSGKYTYHVLRPISVIQKSIQPDWTSLIETPPHPEFPAAHATLSAAAATGLTSALGDAVSFVDDTYRELGMKSRTFASFQAAAAEAGISRLYGGIHYRFSIDEGLKIGKATGQRMLGTIKFK
jgi:hypothetical protein